MGPTYADFCKEITELWSDCLTNTVPSHEKLDVKDVSLMEIQRAVEDCTYVLSADLIRLMTGEFVRVLIIGQRMGVPVMDTVRCHLEAFIEVDSFEQLQNVYKGMDDRQLH